MRRGLAAGCLWDVPALVVLGAGPFWVQDPLAPGWRAPSDAQMQRVVEMAPVWPRPSNIPRLVVEESDFFPSTTWLAAPRIST